MVRRGRGRSGVFRGMVRDGWLPWQGAIQADLNDGRTISVIPQAKGTASARDSEANKGLVWLGDQNKACVAQMENK